MTVRVKITPNSSIDLNQRKSQRSAVITFYSKKGEGCVLNNVFHACSCMLARRYLGFNWPTAAAIKCALRYILQHKPHCYRNVQCVPLNSFTDQWNTRSGRSENNVRLIAWRINVSLHLQVVWRIHSSDLCTLNRQQKQSSQVIMGSHFGEFIVILCQVV